jgi:hypothetical protein
MQVMALEIDENGQVRKKMMKLTAKANSKTP